MGLIFIDGFDHENVTADLCTGSKWTSGSVTLGTTHLPWGIGKSALVNTTLSKTFTSNLPRGIMGFALYWIAGAAASFQFLDAANNQFTVTLDTALSRLSVRTGGSAGTIIGSTATNSVPVNQFSYIEIDGTINNATGAVQVYINGVSALNLTNVNTRPTSTNNYFQIYTMGGNGFWLDDFYALDPSSGPYTAALGGCQVETEFPNSNSAVTWTPLAASNFTEVSETAMDSDTSYNFSASIGQADVFNTPNLSNTPLTIFAVAVTSAIRQETASTRAMQNNIVSGGSTGNGAAVSPATTYQYQQDIFVNDPATGAAWSPAAVNAAKIGYTLTA